MKRRISFFLILSILFLSLIVVPVASAGDGGKSIIKEMVQSPGDYNVGPFLPVDPFFRLDGAQQDFSRYFTWWFERLASP
jgi:hypothetical protein